MADHPADTVASDLRACDIEAIRRQVKNIERKALLALRRKVVRAPHWQAAISGSQLRDISLWRLEPIAADLGALQQNQGLARAISSLRFVALQSSERSDWSRPELWALQQELDAAGKLV